MYINTLITIDSDILGRQPVFTETRVPIESFFNHLEVGVSLDDFLDDFPTVTREQVIAIFDLANKLVNPKNISQFYAAVA